MLDTDDLPQCSGEELATFSPEYLGHGFSRDIDRVRQAQIAPRDVTQQHPTHP